MWAGALAMLLISTTVCYARLRRVTERIQHALAGDATGFYQSVLRDRNERRVCGINCIYAALKAVDGAGGRALHYDYAHDPAGGIVSFTNVLFV